MRRRRGHHAGFTIVECVISLLIVGTMFAVAMSTVGASKMMMLRVSERAQADALASQLMAEILSQDYWSPIYHSGMGPSADEAATGNRSLFDDVDDYNGWSANPPQAKDGTVMTQFSDLTRTVRTPWVDPSDLTTERSDETGVKLITVTVKRGDVVLATRKAIKTVGWTDPAGGS